MMKEKMDVLGQLLGCYFHQDWQDEFDSDASALQAIIESEPKEQLLDGVAAIDMILAGPISEDEVKSIVIDKVGCYFDPHSKGITYKQWLQEIREKLATV